MVGRQIGRSHEPQVRKSRQARLRAEMLERVLRVVYYVLRLYSSRLSLQLACSNFVVT